MPNPTILQPFTPIMMPMVRKVFPTLIASDILDNVSNINPLYKSISSLGFTNIPQSLWNELIGKVIYVDDIHSDYSSFTIVSQEDICTNFMCTLYYKPANEEKYLKSTNKIMIFSYILYTIYHNDKNIELQEYISTQYPYLFI